jgi:hypothetical protein
LAVDFRLRSDEPSTVKAVVTLEKTAGEISASTPRLARPAIKAQATFSKLDIEEVQAALQSLLAAAPPPAAVKKPRNPPKPASWSMAASVSVARGAYRDVRADDLTAIIGRAQNGAWRAEAATPRLTTRGESFSLSTAAVSYENGDLAISHAGFGGLGGGGTLEFSLVHKDEDSGAKAADGLGRRFDLAWNVAGLDSARLLDLLGLRPLAAGRLKSAGSLSGDWTKPRSDELKGAFRVELASGVISGLPGMVKLLSSLNVRSLFRTVEGKGKHVNGLPFRVVSASCTVNAGILRTTAPAALHSDTMDMGLLGSIDLTKNTIQADMVVQFLTVLDEVIRLVPGVKQILIGKRKSMLPIWVKISGPLDDPEVKVQPVKSLEKKLWSTVKGIFTLPENVLSTVTGLGKAK